MTMQAEPADFLALTSAARLSLANLPTPLDHYPALDALVGCEVWIKRDDATAGAEAGNKIRKLEFLMAEAVAQRADVVLTCGGLQSNHARATAVAARRLGMQPVLMLRGALPLPNPREGNLLLDELLGAEVLIVSPEEYAERDQRMRALADDYAARGRRPYVIPEGGSNGLGALGYVAAMAEVRAQLDADPSRLPATFDAVVHACGSGGTGAGVMLGAAHFGVAPRAIAMAVCDDRRYFEARIATIATEATRYFKQPLTRATLRVIDDFKGPAYAVPSADQVAFIRAAARAAGIVLDPVYSGKALFGLANMADKPERVLFVHTGGLPGLLAESRRFSETAA
jgi:D-cysteine desulfhydrase